MLLCYAFTKPDSQFYAVEFHLTERKSTIIIESSASDSDSDEICTCSTSTGNTKLMCRSCRVPSVTKKPSEYSPCAIFTKLY